MSCFSFFLIVQGEGVHLYLFILIFFTVEEEGAEIKGFFFSFNGHVQRGGEEGLVFFRIFFFILEWIGRGIKVFILSIR